MHSSIVPGKERECKWTYIGDAVFYALHLQFVFILESLFNNSEIVAVLGQGHLLENLYLLWLRMAIHCR